MLDESQLEVGKVATLFSFSFVELQVQTLHSIR